MFSDVLVFSVFSAVSACFTTGGGFSRKPDQARLSCFREPCEYRGPVGVGGAAKR